eukprot:TRINITY_DN105876_c0_g1_i1.p1 TRINITY_DN105876_c0_g1~~TRINITY_DN105876_c0_g1_i1.p1  ORF type:complete len:210 (-),score=39.98 TRINITY_DN105876_c0_g1_i1:49-678(-)
MYLRIHTKTWRLSRSLSSAIVPDVLLLGDERLKKIAQPTAHFSTDSLKKMETDLHARLTLFREEHGFGRAIAATQIDHHVRMIACNLSSTDSDYRKDEQPFTICNPVITWKSDEKFSLWDDCMSFPDLLVRVRRHESISLRYEDVDGKEYVWENIPRAVAELLQHETDHLDGVLAVDLAEDKAKDIVKREDFEANEAKYKAMVDWNPGQ